MQCAYCGATLKPDEKVCSQCGAEVAPANPPAAPFQEESIPEAFPYAEPGAQMAETSEPVTVTEPATPAPMPLADIAGAAAISAPGSSRSVLAVASLVMGTLSLCSSFFALCGAPISVIGIILGIMSLKSSKRGLAVAGIALSGLGLLMAILFTLLMGVMGYFSSLPGK